MTMELMREPTVQELVETDIRLRRKFNIRKGAK